MANRSYTEQIDHKSTGVPRPLLDPRSVAKNALGVSENQNRIHSTAAGVDAERAVMKLRPMGEKIDGLCAMSWFGCGATGVGGCSGEQRRVAKQHPVCG